MLIYSLDIIRGFRNDELPSIFNCMKTAIQLSKVTTLGLTMPLGSYIIIIILCSIIFKCVSHCGAVGAMITILRMLLNFILCVTV